MKKIFILLIFTIFSCSVLTTCKKDNGSPPTLPSASSMTIDFSTFVSGKKSADAGLLKGVNQNNWDYAVMVTSYWKTIIAGTLAVPVAAYKYALDQTPSFVGNNTWQWSFNVTVLSVTYSAKLTGQIGADNVTWTMLVSKTGTGSFTDFKWFTGTSALDGNSGQWILNYSPAFDEPVLQIDWTKSGSTINKVKYTYIRTLNDARAPDTFKNSTIEYGSLSGTYNSYFLVHFYYLSQFYDARIEWNTTSGIGHIQCLLNFGDNNYYCWDANHIDTSC